MRGTVVFDLHGVLTEGDAALPGAADAVVSVEQLGLRTAYLTNSGSSTREDVVSVLHRAGVIAEPSQVMTAGWATALWLRRARKGRERLRVLVCGSQRMVRLLAEALEPGDEVGTSVDAAHYVVVGRDPDFHWSMLERVFRAVRDGAALLAPSTDRIVPGRLGEEIGPGPLVRCVEEATGTCSLVIGKPSATALALLLDARDAPAPVWMVGDSIGTDIAAGARFGCSTVLVRTGNGRDYAGGGDVVPDFVIDDIAHLPQLLAAQSQAM